MVFIAYFLIITFFKNQSYYSPDGSPHFLDQWGLSGDERSDPMMIV